MRIVKRTIFWTVGIAALTAIVLGSSWLGWETRSGAIPGVYHADGVWGQSTHSEQTAPLLKRYSSWNMTNLQSRRTQDM